MNTEFSGAMLTFMDERIAAGQQDLALVARELLYHRFPELLERLDLADDRVFLEPLLFARLTLPEAAATMSLEQVLVGYLSAAEREVGIDVTVDGGGTVDIPGIGTIVGAPAGECAHLAWHDGRPILSNSGGTIPCQLVEPIQVSGVPEISRTLHPLLRPLFNDMPSREGEIDVSAGLRHAEDLRSACEHLAILCPTTYRQISTVTRRIVVFNLEGHNSFADLRAHGTAFLSATPEDDDIFFAEDLAHQCGHAVFSAMIFNREHFLAVPSETPLSALDAASGEDRTVYTALHGIYTEACMVQALSAWLESAANPAMSRRKHELEGRLAFILRRFGSDLSRIRRPVFFTSLGSWLVDEIEKVFAFAYSRWRSLVLCVDLSNQPYVFSYAEYARANPR